MPKLQEVQISQEEKDRIAREGPVIDLVKAKKEDVIDHACIARLKAGSLTSTTPNNKATEANMIIFTLR